MSGDRGGGGWKPLPDNFDPFGGASSGKGSGSLETARTAADLGTKLVKAVLLGHKRRQVAAERERQQADMEAKLAAPPPVHGSAAWATSQELSDRGLLREPAAFDNPSSILLGAVQADGAPYPDGWLHWDGQGHLVTVARTRSGKSTTQILPNLVRYRGSCVVLDPKGELYEQTADWRRTVGDVYRIAPFEAETHAFNPLDMVQSAADARALADLLIPEDPNAQEYFRKDAIAFLNGAIQYTKYKAPNGSATLNAVRTLTALPSKEFMLVGQRMSESHLPAVANAGNILLGKSLDRGLPALRDTLNTELSLWDDPAIKRATAQADFKFHDLKDRPATVYITFPFDKMKPFAPFLRVLLASGLEAMIQNRNVPEIDVLFVLDEFLSLGTFPQFQDAIRTHASAGVRLWFFLQNLPKLEELYPTSWRSFFDASVQSFFGVNDIYTGGVVSEILGETTVAHKSTSYTLGASLSREDFLDTSSTDSLNVSHTVNLSARRLMTPAEVVQDLAGALPDQTRRGIISIEGVRPVRALMVPYYLGQTAKKRISQRRGYDL